MSELVKMRAGEHYDAFDQTLVSMRANAREATRQYNLSTQVKQAERTLLLEALFATTGDNIYIEPSFRCDYGTNISVGDNFYANFDCVILDCAPVIIGNNCFMGPQVGIYTACHPIDPIHRNSGVEFAKAVTIGDNCWIGGHATINPGVQLGDNVVVGAGSVVTKSFTSNVVIAGNPARVIKEI